MMDFDRAFEVLTGAPPLSWQKRLFREHFAQNNIPHVIDLPTGLGKTMVMAIWLIARASKLVVPTRLIYVVDRRTVVDQATDLVEKLVKNWKERRVFESEPPAISTLRGQLADNREWSRDPSRPAIIIGTVDLIGSALLFSGYRSSFKRRPLEAGLLGQDSLLVLDEAHLSKPFERLLGSISAFQQSHGKPMNVIRMSATSGSANQSDVFQLDTNPESETFDLWSKLDEKGDEQNPIKKRFDAKKHLSIVNTEKPVDTIAIEANKLATEKPGSRIVIFVKTPRQVADVRKALERRNKDHATRISQLTGTMRGLERDELVDCEKPLGEGDHERRVMQRFLKPDNEPSQGSCFLVSTSAGEVGFDLNADHLVGDEAPLDSWIQRLGRANRRGYGDARVVLVRDIKRTDKTDFDKSCSATTKLFDKHLDGRDVGPKSLASFMRSLAFKQPEQIELATSPTPTIVALTDILLDAWSMTSIITQMPGRPEVGPWLRGIDDELPQTTIAWRAELDLDGFANLDPSDIEEWFDTHRILTHETLCVKTSDAATWFKDRWDALSKTQQSELTKSPVIIDRAGLEIVSLGEIFSRKANDFEVFFRGAEVILPASFGGIRRGLLDKGEEEKSFENQVDTIDVADVHGRYREKIVKPEGGEAESTPLIPGAVKPKGFARFALELESEDEQDEKTVRLVSYVPGRERPETGQNPQTLERHVSSVRKAVDDVVSRLKPPSEITQAAQFAADWHDHGKARERWQRLLVFRADFARTDEPMGKSGGEMKRDPRGYRHEFGSLREFTDAFNAGNLLDNSGNPINQEVFELAAHLIAAHHGRGRPHFPKGGFDPDCEVRTEEIHTEAIRRYAQLQRKYGWWRLAWLENLLRCADALASANDKIDEAEGGEQ